ncbi:MAG: PPC domain-containing protein [Myxococcota bacterium]
MSQTKRRLMISLGIILIPSVAQAGWQGRRAKCVKPDSAITTEQQQSLSAAVRGGTAIWNAAGSTQQASASASTNQVLSQQAYDQAWIRYELCMALDNNHIDQETYNRLLEQSLMRTFNSASTPTPTPPPTPTPTPTPVSTTPAETTPAETPRGADTTQWKAQLQTQTELRSGSAYADMAGYGYSLLDVARTGLLDAQTATTVPVNLPAGYEYALMGVCDNDCSDLDLTVSKGGMELSVDSSRDDWPVVTITPTGSAAYDVKVAMFQCSTSNCGYQLTVWRRPVPEAPPAAVVGTPSDGPATVQLGEVREGRLVAGDHTLPNGEWADRYTLSLQAGQTVRVGMRSADVDTYLVALAPSGHTEQNDDCDGDRARSCLNFVAPEGGDWTIFATSYQSGDDGAYSLSVESGP